MHLLSLLSLGGLSKLKISLNMTLGEGLEPLIL